MREVSAFYIAQPRGLCRIPDRIQLQASLLDVDRSTEVRDLRSTAPPRNDILVIFSVVD